MMGDLIFINLICIYLQFNFGYGYKDKHMLFPGVDLVLNLNMGHEFLYGIAGYLVLKIIIQFLEV